LLGEIAWQLEVFSSCGRRAHTGSVAGNDRPNKVLALQGDVLLIDKGNRARLMAIGVGASTVRVNMQYFPREPERTWF